MSRGRKKRILGQYDAKKRQWLHNAERFALLLVLVFLFFQYVIGVSAVSGKSMLNTLQNGDIVLYTRINGEIHKGQIIAVSLPSGEYYVKRVIAVGGDTVDLIDGEVYVNGIRETGDYFIGETLAEEGAFAYPLTVEKGDLFVLGDNRKESIDSRFFGAVSSKQIAGVLRLRFGRWFIQTM